jgi:hypothetical protein
MTPIAWIVPVKFPGSLFKGDFLGSTPVGCAITGISEEKLYVEI